MPGRRSTVSVLLTSRVFEGRAGFPLPFAVSVFHRNRPVIRAPWTLGARGWKGGARTLLVFAGRGGLVLRRLPGARRELPRGRGRCALRDIAEVREGLHAGGLAALDQRVDERGALGAFMAAGKQPIQLEGHRNLEFYSDCIARDFDVRPKFGVFTEKLESQVDFNPNAEPRTYPEIYRDSGSACGASSTSRSLVPG